MSYDATNMTPREHQQLIRDNIAESVRKGDYDRATILRKAFAPLLAIKFPDLPDPKRVPSSPINKLPL